MITTFGTNDSLIELESLKSFPKRKKWKEKKRFPRQTEEKEKRKVYGKERKKEKY